jgi:hypothetical protein
MIFIALLLASSSIQSTVGSTNEIVWTQQGRRERVRASVKNLFSGPSSKGGPADIFLCDFFICQKKIQLTQLQK